MGKKLLFLVFILLAYLSPSIGWAQSCPTTVSIVATHLDKDGATITGTNICSGTEVTFTATVNASTDINYQWFINGSGQGVTSSLTQLTTTTLQNSNTVKLVIKTNDNSCTKESNILTMTVNPVLTPSVSISASKTTICPGENITFNASPINGGNNPTYIWKIDETNSGTGNSFSTTGLTNGQSVTVELTSNATCASPTTVTSPSPPITINVKPGTPANPGTISGQANVCPGISSLTYSIAAVANATSYEWTLPSGWSGNSTSTSISATSGATGSGTISVKAKNDCGTSDTQSFDVTVLAGTPIVPSTITGSNTVCPSTTETPFVTYSVNNDPLTTEYIWTLPTGFTGTSSSSSIDVIIPSSGSGNITVKAKNSCGTSAAKTLAVSVKPGTPAVPTAISGLDNICPNTTNTYSISAVPNATSYEWLLPSGWAGTSTTTSINATSNSTGGNITVKALNDCGTSTEQSLTITIKPGTPAAPLNLSGSNAVCPNTSETYTVTNDATATEYIWTLPSGWTGTSTTSSITVNTATSGSGNITVKAKNDCGTSAAASIAVSVKAPAPVMSGAISGNATVCSGKTGLIYTIPVIANTDSYIWTLPSGWTGTSTTNSITATAGSSGNISVIARNTCGDSAPSASFVVSSASGVPATPGAITSSLAANSNVCPPLTGITFSVAAVANATGYNWIMPTGWEITSGANTNSIIARANSNTPFPATQSVKVEATNICGSSTGQSSSDNITIDDHVSATIGADQTVCKATTPITINASVGFAGKKISVSATHNGTGNLSGVPNGKVDNFNFTYTPSQNDLDTRTQVTITLTTEKPNGACSAGQDEMVIFFKPDPTASISGTSTICTGNATNITFTGTANTTVTYKKNGGADQTIAIDASGTATLNTGALTATTTYTLGSVRYTTAPNCPKTITGSAVVTITPKPTATISYGASPYSKCLNTDQPVTLTGTGAYTNGSYLSSPSGLILNTTTGGINPSTSTVGTYTVTYTAPASGGCTEVAVTTEVTIIAVPTITLSYAGTPYCSDNATSPTPNLGGTGNYQGGTYSATSGLSITSGTGAINFASSTPGTHTVTYTLTPSTGCTPITQTAPVVITEKPTPNIAYSAAEFCKSLSNSQSVNLTGTGIITGGTFTSSSSGLNIDSNGAVNPSLSAAGNYTITYTLAAANGCQVVSTTTSLIISDIPSAEISYAGPFCQSDSTAKTVIFSNTAGAYQNGTFTGTAGLTIDATTGAIIPSSSQSGTHTVTYRIPASVGCTTVDITTQVVITPVPTASISYAGPFCSSDATSHSVSFSNTAGAYQNGVFSGTNGLSIAADGSVTPSTSSAGTHTITYTIPTADGCQEVVSTTAIEIFEKVLITTQPSNLGICSTQPASFEVIASGDNLAYQWKRIDGATITNATGINTSKLSFNNATSINSGEYFVEVSGNAACPSIATSEPVWLNIDENIIIIKPTEDQTYCENEVTELTFEYIAHANGAELTFEWIKDGVKLPSTTNPVDKYTYNKEGPSGVNGEYSGTLTISYLDVDDNGVYAVKIKGPDYFTCPDATSKSFTLSILDQPDPPATVPLTYCQGDVAPALIATGTKLLWYLTDDPSEVGSSTAPTPTTSTPGTTTFWVSQSPLTCESPRAELVVTVKEKPGLPTTTETLNYCLNEVATPLVATGDTGNMINWFNSAGATTPLGAAPTPDTSTDVTTNYWVSQTKDGCESDRVQISINVNPLPIFTVTASALTICSGTSTTLTATGDADSYNWVEKGTTVSLGASATLLASPTSETIYEVTGTSDKGCTSVAEITIQVDQQSAGGVITPSTSTVCVSGNSGTISIAGSGYVGSIQRWESSLDNGTTWASISNTSENLTYTNLTQTTQYRVAVKSGICDEAFSTTSEITVDPVPIGGKLLFNNNERIYLTCESPSASSLSPISISDHSGTIVSWKYRKSTAGSWTTIQSNGTNFTGTTLSASQIFGFGVTETMVFQVEISSGACSPNALSQTAILSVIPSDIEPTPVTIDPDVLCFGDEVTLQSSTGYTDRPNFLDQGAFDNASITNHGWRVRRNNDPTDIGFDTDANNIRPDRWKRATRHQFTTANINSPYNTREDLYISSNGPNDPSGNKGFAIVSSDNSATLETPVFAIGGLDQAILTWDQMYNLTPGASIKVEISTDGGNTYSNVLYSVSTPPDPSNTTGVSSGNYDGFSLGTIATRPKNKIKVDLGYYMGQPNLRIRFSYIGIRVGDVWAIDNIDIPDGPRGVELVWYDYTDELNPIYIGDSETETWTPRKVGYNEFEVRTKLLLDSSGQACQSIENFERVIAFAFDQYVSTTTIVTGSCGTIEAQLSGVVEGIGSVPEISGTPPIPGVPAQGVITSFPTDDGYNAAWTVVGPAGYTVNETHFISDPSFNPPSTDPNALFKPGVEGTYTLTWTLSSNEYIKDEAGNDILTLPVPVNDGCPPTYNPAEFTTLGCTTLDFDGVNDYVDLGTTYNSTYSMEAWVRPEEADGTIISKKDSHSSGDGFELYLNNSKPVFKWNGGVLTASQSLDLNKRWYHLAVSFNGTAATLYIDGIEVVSHTTGSAVTNSIAPLLIGASYDISTSLTTDHFSGWIEEVRFWNTTITEKQIRFLMNQHLINNGAQMGEQIPMDVPEGLTYANLAGYYRLIAQINAENPDPAFQIVNGFTPDMAPTSIPGRLNNMETYQENTAPLPYTSRIDNQTWNTDDTWTHWPVWDVPNSNGVTGTPIDWNIVRINHNINSGDRDITVLGLKSESGRLTIAQPPPAAQDEYNSGHMLWVTHYLKLDGSIDLVGESQLIQKRYTLSQESESILEETSAGWLKRDQQGKKMSFNYNYWSSPVSEQGAANNAPYLPKDVMNYGWLNAAAGTVKPLVFTPDSNPYGADNLTMNTCPYWLWRFHGLADDYDSWIFIGSTGTLKTGEGHTMKGTTYTGTADYSHSQNYGYKGKPHNGDINLSIALDENYLVGNPYPSALDVVEFIYDNLDANTVNGARNTKNLFNGAVYFWDHFSGATHILREYIGGYAVLNITGGVRAISTDDRINATSEVSIASKTPTQFIPVGQGFFVSSVVDEEYSGGLSFTTSPGDLIFKNRQRVFSRESGSPANSVFLKPETVVKTGKEEAKSSISKIRISFRSPKGYNRQILVGAHPNSTNGFDLGYDAPMIEYNVEDMFWLQGNNYLVIQGVPDFGKAQVLPLGIRIEKEGEFKIKIDTLENINDDHTIYLKDIVLDTIHDIRSGPYVSTSVAGEITERFQLIFYKEINQDPVIDEPIIVDEPIIDDLTDISLLHSYTKNEMMVLNPQELRISAIYLYDMNGKLLSVFEDVPSEKEIRLKVANFSEGVYVLKMHTDNEIITRKIIIKN